MTRALRVAICADFIPGAGIGGVESVITGLAHALGELHDDVTEYTIVCSPEGSEWIRPHLGPNQKAVCQPAPLPPPPSSAERLKQMFGAARPTLGKILRSLIPKPPQPLQVPMSDGFYESLGCDVVHFAWQKFAVCAVPTIYNPHDLQHIHYPGFFDAEHVAWREVTYRAGCEFSKIIAVGSQWVKQDLIRHYGLEPKKIQVIPWAPPTQAHLAPAVDEIYKVRRQLHLPELFALYPAMTWPHKNHIRLLQAVALLRDRNSLQVNLICTGKQNEYWPEIERVVSRIGLSDRVRFLGLLPMDELRAVYRAAQFVIIPTLFEAASGPLFEAWEDGVPAACSNVTSLPEQAADAALLFDPLSVEAIAEALLRMSKDIDLRETLKKRGGGRLRDFSWERTAKAYRATYRMAAGVPLTEEDRSLLNWDWMRDPKRNSEIQPI